MPHEERRDPEEVPPAGSAPADARPEPVRPSARTRLLSWLHRHAGLVAFVVGLGGLLLVRREFVDGYQIPSESMAPTLHGDPQDGDKILVFKKPFWFRDPDRWDIAVFRRDTANPYFIKRIVGLPGEWIEIRDGDVWVDGKIARKPRAIEEDMLVTVASGLDPASFDRHWVADRREGFGFNEAEGALVVVPDTTVVFSHQGDVRDSIETGTHSQKGRHPVGDLELEIELTPTSTSGTVVVSLHREGDWFDVSFPIGVGHPTIRMPGAETSLDLVEPLASGNRAVIRVTHVDRRLRIARDGREIYSRSYDSPGGRVDGPSNRASFAVVEGGAKIHGLELRRDVYYTADGEFGVDGPILVPRGEDRASRRYYVLGDNSSRSKDSRFWGRDARRATIPFRDLVGVPVAVFWPPGRMRALP